MISKRTISVGSVGVNENFLSELGDSAAHEAQVASRDELSRRIEAKEFDFVSIGGALIGHLGLKKNTGRP